jgi:hypothetical protein
MKIYIKKTIQGDEYYFDIDLNYVLKASSEGFVPHLAVRRGDAASSLGYELKDGIIATGLPWWYQHEEDFISFLETKILPPNVILRQVIAHSFDTTDVILKPNTQTFKTVASKKK